MHSNALYMLATIVLVAGCSSESPVPEASSTSESQPSAQEEPSTKVADSAQSDQSIAATESPQPKQADASTSADDSPGLAVGEKAPEFELKDQQGRSQSLEGILAKGNAALVFYRSADW